MYLYEINLNKFNQLILPNYDQTILHRFNNGLLLICSKIEGGTIDNSNFYLNSNLRCTKLLNLFATIEDNDTDTLITFYLLIHNVYEYTKLATTVNDVVYYNKAIGFVTELLDYLDENGYNIINVYGFIIETYYSKYYLTKLKFYDDLKVQLFENINIIDTALNALKHEFSGEKISENTYLSLVKTYAFEPKISILKNSEYYRNYREAEIDYIKHTTDFLNGSTDTDNSADPPKTIFKDNYLGKVDTHLKNLIIKIFSAKDSSLVPSLYYSEFPFLKMYYFKHDLLKDTELSKDLCCILGKWYEHFTQQDFFIILLEFIDYLFSDDYNIQLDKTLITFNANFNEEALASFLESRYTGHIYKDYKYDLFNETILKWIYPGNIDGDDTPLKKIRKKRKTSITISDTINTEIIVYDAINLYFNEFYNYLKQNMKVK